MPLAKHKTLRLVYRLDVVRVEASHFPARCQILFPPICKDSWICGWLAFRESIRGKMFLKNLSERGGAGGAPWQRLIL
jgi:hypothetical protein